MKMLKLKRKSNKIKDKSYFLNLKRQIDFENMCF